MILITGASSGIGKACAIQWSQILEPRTDTGQACGLMLIARRKDRLDYLRKEIAINSSIKIQTEAIDLTDFSACKNWMQKSSNFPGQCQIAVLNAGLAKGMCPIDQVSWTDAQTMVQTNLLSIIQWSQWLIQGWRKAGVRGHLILMGSVAGRWNYPNGNVYAASKAAVHSLAESIRLDVQGTGIRVTEILPGMVETEFSEVRLGDTERAKSVYRNMTPLSAEDIAKSVIWVAQQPEHINIQEIVIYPTDQASPNHVYRHS